MSHSVPGAAPVPLSPLQEQVWLAARLSPDSPALTVPLVLRLDGRPEPAALADALSAVIRRHDVLSGHIEVIDGAAVHVPRVHAVELPFLDLPADPDEPVEDLPPLEPPDPREQLFTVRLVRRGPQTYFLQFLFHHLAFDGTSAQILVRELCAAYDAIRQGAAWPHALPAAPVRYADYALSARAALDSPATAAALARWRRELEGAEDLLVATDRPRLAPVSLAGGSHEFALGAETAARLRELAAAGRTTAFAAVAAAFAVCLAHRAGASGDAVLAIPSSARRRPEWAETVGLFANVVPLRVRIAADPTFRELVAGVSEDTVRVLGEPDLPLSMLVDALRPRRDAGRRPLCPVSVQLTPGLAARGRTIDFTTTRRFAARACSEFELGLYVSDGPEPAAVLEYSTQLFDSATAAAVAEEFTELCADLAARPDRPISSADRLGSRRDRLAARSRGAAAVPRERTVHGLVGAQARRTPNAIAVACGDRRLSYRELDAAAARLARRMRANGVARGDQVVVAVDRGAGLPVALLGVLKAGAGYVPLDEQLPAARAAAGPALVRPAAAVADLERRAAVEALGLAPIGFDLDELLADAAERDERDELAGPDLPEVDGEDLAYVMFTSGTTGEPKAVAVPHRGVTSLADRPSYAAIRPADVVGFVAPAHFDASTFEIWAALANGATLAVAPDTRLSPAALEEFVDAHGVTVLHLTAGLLRVTADERPGLFSRLRHLLTGGDVVSPAALHRVMTAHPRLNVTCCYGPTEVTTFASVAPQVHADPTSPVAIGRPIAGRELYVFDALGDLASPGVPGQILVGGAGLARGYLNRPGLTAERFVPHPFEPGARLYRTGDLGRADASGTVHFLGRSDRQLKIRGFRVEPGEVESALLAHPAVRDVLVRPRSQEGERFLVGYLVADRLPPTDAELRAFLHERVPVYCVPRAFLTLPAFPATGSGKTDVAALDVLPLDSSRAQLPAASASEREEAVLEVWRSLLEHPGLGPEEDFFSNGGDSLKALRAAERLERALGLAVPASALFEHPTARRLAGYLDEAPSAPRAAAIVPEDLLAQVTGASEQDVAALLESLRDPDPPVGAISAAQPSAQE